MSHSKHHPSPDSRRNGPSSHGAPMPNSSRADASRQQQPAQQQQYQSRPGQNAPAPQQPAGAPPNQLGQNQAGQAQGRPDPQAATRQQGERFQASRRREDGADRPGSSYDPNASGTSAAAQRAQPSPNTPNGERAGRDQVNINRSPMDEAGSVDEGGQGHEVGRDASRAATTRSANASRVADQTNSNQTDKDRQAMKNR